jgi:hypothetical protein
LTGSLCAAFKPAGEKQVLGLWIAERIDRLCPSSRIVEHHDDSTRGNSLALFGSARKVMGRLSASRRPRRPGGRERVEQWISRIWFAPTLPMLCTGITVSGKKPGVGGETDLFLDGFLRECLLVAARA